jgi:serine/threonine protein phosphatase 1
LKVGQEISLAPKALQSALSVGICNYDPDLPLDQQDDRTLRWLSLRDSVPRPHRSGRVAVLGHTPQPEILNLGHLICLDTGCAHGGKLTAMEVGSGEVWQAGTTL